MRRLSTFTGKKGLDRNIQKGGIKMLKKINFILIVTFMLILFNSTLVFGSNPYER